LKAFAISRIGCSPGKPEPEETEVDKSPLPKVIRNGPTNGDDHGL